MKQTPTQNETATPEAETENVAENEKELGDKITFFAFIIPEFAAAFKMKVSDAYQFLKQHGGLDFLNRHWWTLHTEDPYWAVRSMLDICKEDEGTEL